MLDILSDIPRELLLFILIFLIWSAGIIYLDKKGILKRHNMDRIWFIALMWRTRKGRKLIDKIASAKKFWLNVSTGGFVLFFVGMIMMFILIGLSAVIASTSPLVEPVGAKEVLVLPGINPYVPFIYGIIGLIVAVVAHELSHGIIARVMGFKVKALGLLFILIPMGAFMEPDDKEVEKGSRIARMRMFAAGPVMNFLLAFMFIGIFSWGMIGSLEAEGDPLILTDISTDSPARISLEDTPKAIYSINGTAISSYEDLFDHDLAQPGEWVVAEMKMNGGKELVPLISGVIVIGVGEGTPAEETDIKEGSILYSLNGVLINSSRDFSDLMDDTGAGEVITLALLEPEFDEEGEVVTTVRPPEELLTGEDAYEGTIRYPDYHLVELNVTLDDKYDHYGMEVFRGKGYIGITSTYMGLSGIGSTEFLETLNRPVYSAPTLGGKIGNLAYITFRLPLELEKMPFHDPLTDIYEVQGPLSVLPEPVFWFLANTIFYIFWLNILLGLFNALPMVPLDGGFVFRDTVVLLLKKVWRRTPEEKLEAIAKKISVAASLLVLFMILLSVLGPRLKLLF